LKVLVVSDSHGSKEASQKAASKACRIQADLIINSGDITHFGTVHEAQRLLQPLTALNKPILLVPGNCDPPEMIRTQLNGATCLHGKCHMQEDIAFIGLGGAPKSFLRSLFELTEDEIAKTLNQALKECPQSRMLAIVSHATPKDTRLDLTFAKLHVGSVSLRQFIEEKKPNVVFCGHIHEAKGVDHIGETLLVNPGPVRHGYCAIVEMGDKIEVKLDTL
jgi:Icc-related predicted phosphoesterase